MNRKTPPLARIRRASGASHIQGDVRKLLSRSRRSKQSATRHAAGGEPLPAAPQALKRRPLASARRDVGAGNKASKSGGSNQRPDDGFVSEEHMEYLAQSYFDIQEQSECPMR